jgi:L-talarate/galactarate dehydratase
MKVGKVTCWVLRIPFTFPLVRETQHALANFVEIETEEGLKGHALSTYPLKYGIREFINREAAPVVEGMDPMRPELIRTRLFWATARKYFMGAWNCAASLIDIALWDIRGKALGLPLWRLLGGARERVPTYASGALMRGLSLDRVVKAAATLKEKGWREMKTQLALPGETTPAKEVERMKLIREAIGPDIKLMCDINQRWRPEQAVDIGRRVEDAGVGLFWLEDVTTADDYAGLARVADALSTPVAGGEYLWGIVPFRHMMERRSVDIPMIDQVRCGGITQWLKIAGMAEAFNLPVVSHGVPEIHVHLVGAVPNGLTVEYMPRLFPLWKAVPQPVDGDLLMPSAPGLGLEFDQVAIDKYRA